MSQRWERWDPCSPSGFIFGTFLRGMVANDSGSKFGDPATDLSSSEKFMAIVKATVEFGPDLPDVPGLKEEIVRLTVLGKPEKAMEVVRTSSTMSASETEALVENIGLAADRAFYATGLRP